MRGDGFGPDPTLLAMYELRNAIRASCNKLSNTKRLAPFVTSARHLGRALSTSSRDLLAYISKSTEDLLPIRSSRQSGADPEQRQRGRSSHALARARASNRRMVAGSISEHESVSLSQAAPSASQSDRESREASASPTLRLDGDQLRGVSVVAPDVAAKSSKQPKRISFREVPLGSSVEVRKSQMRYTSEDI